MKLTPKLVIFEVYNPYSIVQMSEVLKNVTIYRGDRTIYNGRAFVRNMVGTGVMYVVSATLADELQIEALEPGDELRSEFKSFVDNWLASHESLKNGYHRIVGDIRNFLTHISRWIEQGESVVGVEGEDGINEEMAQQFLNDIATEIWPTFEKLFYEFEVQANEVPEELIEIHKAFAQAEIHPLIMISPFMHRTYEKPLGYAGDYEMVNMLLRDPWEGANTYAKLINAILVKSDTAQAHRNRIDLLVQRLSNECQRVKAQGRDRIKILNVGCGPAAELVRFIRNSDLSDMLDIEMMDFNEETLVYAENEIIKAIKECKRKTNVRFVHLSIHDLLRATSRQSEPLPLALNYDYVYCAGLFDYLPDKRCQRLIKLFYQWVNPGGMVAITNVHPKHSIKGFLEHIQEWVVILRTEDELLRLAGDLGTRKIESEPTGINVFLDIRKPQVG
ncbi:MAG: SAM-dependent methyltransferase [Phycisphaeraceae bacterium]|nr:SAM-dependent methyltransferase [Phycisphaeraceae bacterium]